MTIRRSEARSSHMNSCGRDKGASCSPRESPRAVGMQDSSIGGGEAYPSLTTSFPGSLKIVKGPKVRRVRSHAMLRAVEADYLSAKSALHNDPRSTPQLIRQLSMSSTPGVSRPTSRE